MADEENAAARHADVEALLDSLFYIDLGSHAKLVISKRATNAIQGRVEGTLNDKTKCACGTVLAGWIVVVIHTIAGER